jgi:hypothetical protein
MRGELLAEEIHAALQSWIKEAEIRGLAKRMLSLPA